MREALPSPRRPSAPGRHARPTARAAAPARPGAQFSGLVDAPATAVAAEQGCRRSSRTWCDAYRSFGMRADVGGSSSAPRWPGTAEAAVDADSGGLAWPAGTIRQGLDILLVYGGMGECVRRMMAGDGDAEAGREEAEAGRRTGERRASGEMPGRGGEKERKRGGAGRIAAKARADGGAAAAPRARSDFRPRNAAGKGGGAPIRPPPPPPPPHAPRRSRSWTRPAFSTYCVPGLLALCPATAFTADYIRPAAPPARPRSRPTLRRRRRTGAARSCGCATAARGTPPLRPGP